MPQILALALAIAASGDAAAPRPQVTPASATATATVEIIRFEPVLSARRDEPALLRRIDARRRQVDFY